jgi:hypothetical protein
VKFHPDLVNCIFWSCNSYRLQTSCDTSLRPEEGRGVSGATDGMGEGSLGKFHPALTNCDFHRFFTDFGKLSIILEYSSTTIFSR